MLALGAILQIVGHTLRAWMPPFALFVTTFFFVALGQAYNDTQANTFVAASKGAAHRWLAIIHASFMAGCLVGPFVATGIASAGTESKWYLFYIFPVGLNVVNLGLMAYAFRDTLSLNFRRAANSVSASDAETRETEQQEQQQTALRGDDSRGKSAVQLIKSTLSLPSVWLLSMFFFFYIGSQITLSGWVVEYLVEVRDGDLSKMGFVPAGFNVSLPEYCPDPEIFFSLYHSSFVDALQN